MRQISRERVAFRLGGKTLCVDHLVHQCRQRQHLEAFRVDQQVDLFGVEDIARNAVDAFSGGLDLMEVFKLRLASRLALHEVIAQVRHEIVDEHQRIAQVVRAQAEA